MKHARRLGAAAVASGVSLLATLGLGEAIDATNAPSGQPQAAGHSSVAKELSRSIGPSGILVIRRSSPSGSARTIYVQAPPSTSAPAVVPAAPTTRSS